MKPINIRVPDGKSGVWAVETFTVSDEQAKFSRLRAAIGHSLEAVEAGTYKRLVRGGTIVMSNTMMELRTNRAIIFAATGDVLINGLGLGMVLEAILQKPAVTSVTVIEKSPDVIALVGPTYANDPRVTIIEADALTYKPEPKRKFAAVWHDIWDNICSDNLASMTALKRKYARRTSWQQCWGQYECLRNRSSGY